MKARAEIMGDTPSLMPPAIREMLCARDSLRNLGFANNEIYAAFNSDGYAGLHLSSQGMTFDITCGAVAGVLTKELAVTMWTTAANQHDSSPASELWQMYQRSWIRRNHKSLVEALLRKGFWFPRCLQ